MRIANGDEMAFAAVVEQYTSIIYAQLLIFLKDAHRAEELTQDILMSIWRNRAKLADMENFPGYVYVTTRNRTLTVIKEKLFATTELPSDKLQSLLATPESAVQFKELLNAIQKGVDHLPPRRKEVFKLSRWENLTYEEIALRLGISKNAVKQHITESLAFLRNYLKQEMDVIVTTLLWVGCVNL